MRAPTPALRKVGFFPRCWLTLPCRCSMSTCTRRGSQADQCPPTTDEHADEHLANRPGGLSAMRIYVARDINRIMSGTGSCRVSTENPLWGRVSGCFARHNPAGPGDVHRLSRKARTASGGWYRPVLVSRGVTRSRAACLRVRSAFTGGVGGVDVGMAEQRLHHSQVHT